MKAAQQHVLSTKQLVLSLVPHKWLRWALALALLSSLAASAQVTDTVGNHTVGMTFFLSCANGGKGETVAFTGQARAILHSAFASNGHIEGNGFLMWADTLRGK